MRHSVSDEMNAVSGPEAASRRQEVRVTVGLTTRFIYLLSILLKQYHHV